MTENERLGKVVGYEMCFAQRQLDLAAALDKQAATHRQQANDWLLVLGKTLGDLSMMRKRDGD